jgi:hypothetical protein
MRIPGFIGGSCTEHSVNLAAERCLNLYPHRVQGGIGKNEWADYRVPSYRIFALLGSSSVRDLFEINGRCFAVSGTGFYELASNGTVTLRGTVAEDANPATMCSNGTAGHQVFVTSGGNGYIFDLNSNAFGIIADADFPNGDALMGAFIDGYFVVLNGETGAFQISALEDGLTWDGLDIAQVSHSPDLTRSLVVDNRQIWLPGRKLAGVWFNSGNADFPFEPTQNQIAQGIAAPFTLKRLDNSILWLGRNEHGDGVLYRAQQFLPLRVSTHAVEQLWKTYSTLEDAYAYTEQWMGHSFYHLQIPAAENAPDPENRVTWTYDVATGLWHERAILNSATGLNLPDIARCHAYSFEKHLVGDRRTGVVYEARVDVFDDELVVVT